MARQCAPDYLGTEVLDRPDFVSACVDRDLGTMFKIACKWGGLGFSPSHLARRCEMTVSRVQDYMSGRRHARSVHVFERVSDGLHIPSRMLGIGHRPWEAESQAPDRAADVRVMSEGGASLSCRPTVTGFLPAASPAIAELCAVLTGYGFTGDLSTSSQYGDVPPLENLVRDLEISYAAYQSSRFTMAASRIATLLPYALLAARESKPVDRARASGILALSYQAAASVLAKAGESHLAWIADRAWRRFVFEYGFGSC
jgi:hypothetical protein